MCFRAVVCAGALVRAVCVVLLCLCFVLQSLKIQKYQARLAQSAERKALNLVVVGSSPTVGVVRSMEREQPQPICTHAKRARPGKLNRLANKLLGGC